MENNNYPSRIEKILIATINGEPYDEPTGSRIEELLIELKSVIEEGGGGGVTEEITYEGVPPLTFESDGDPASAYSFVGNLVQTGTPAPTAPVYASEVGTLVESGEHTGEYAVPITVGGATHTIYLSAPLRKIGDYADTLSSDGTVTRRIGKVVLTGNESFTNSSSAVSYTPKDGSGNAAMLAMGECVCSHYPYSGKSISSSPNNSTTTNSGNGKGIWFKTDYAGDKAAFASYAAAQYSNNTPITVWFVLAAETTETISNCPVLSLVKGNNTLSFGTLSPSQFEITCTITSGGGSSITANHVEYDNTTSGLSAENVQGAIDIVLKKTDDQNRRLCGGGGACIGASTLTDGTKLELPSTNCKKNNVFSFMARISAFDTLLLGQGFETYSGAWVEINDTKLIVHNYQQSDSTVEYTHGLTISDYIYVQIFVNISKADVVIFSNGTTFKQTNITWNSCNGKIFAESAGSTLTDCTLRWSSPDFRKSTWVFGDSYVGLNNPARWATVLRNAGFADNIYLNGYAGEASAAAVTALETALTYYGQPAMLVWCLGMNDGADSGDIPSERWTSGISRVEELCAAYDINLVLATIPSVPSHSNEAKNSYIRNSGRRYIDFADAVGAQADGTWFAGMLSNDNVHPSESGATALYHRAIMDVPELMSPNP